MKVRFVYLCPCCKSHLQLDIDPEGEPTLWCPNPKCNWAGSELKDIDETNPETDCR